MSAAPFDLDALGAGLPFAPALPALGEALRGSGRAVVQAPPGTGKTTLVPPALATWFPGGRVVVTGPRRVAVRAAAARLAALTGTAVGELAGFTVRAERRVGPGCRVEFVTPGVLVRRLVADPDLPGVAAVALDEVHERGLETDLALAFLRDVLELRDDLPVVAMSATLDADRFAALLGEPGVPAPTVDSPATEYPLEVRYAPAPGGRTDARGVRAELLDHVARETARALGEHPGDALVFVPGVREIDHVCRALEPLVGAGVEVLALHGGLGAREQDRVVRGGTGRRVVVSTDVAESSLTVPGVRIVVDACLAREPRLDIRRGMQGLVTVSASRDSCAQRAGRAARLGPGWAVRCVSAQEWATLPEHRTPAIATSDLTGWLLDAACWGAPRAEDLALLDAPPPGALRLAEDALLALGALDEAGAATPAGRRLAGLPVDPRIARALLAAAPVVGARRAAEVAALLGSDEPVPGGDLAAELRRRLAGPTGGPLRREADRLERLARGGEPVAADAADAPPAISPEHLAGAVTALAFPERVARRRGEQYTLASGTGAAPGPAPDAEWLAVAEVGRVAGRSGGRAGAVVRSAAPITREIALWAAAGLRASERVVGVDRGRVTARAVERLGGIELSRTAVGPTVDEVAGALREALRSEPEARDLGLDAPAEALRRRLGLAHRVLGGQWPDVSDAALAERLDEWLGPELPALAEGRAWSSLDLASSLRRLVPWQLAGALDEVVPERIAVPSGVRHRVDYPAVDSDAAPVLAVKLQECFGLRTGPTVCQGRVPVSLHLLSPAGRPLAVTGDLEFFWAEAYPGVRAEMRGRYPKHPWPEDPLTAVATARTTRRG